MRDPYWDEADWAPRRSLPALRPYFRFLARGLAPVVLAATLADTLGTALVFTVSPGAVAREANPLLHQLWPIVGAWALIPAALLEFAGDFTFAAWVALGFFLLWLGAQFFGGNPSGWWTWPALACAAFPFFAVSTWAGALVGFDTFAVWPAFFVVVSAVAFVVGWVPAGHSARQRWEA